MSNDNLIARNLAFQAALAVSVAADQQCSLCSAELAAIERELNPEQAQGVMPGLVPEFVRIDPRRVEAKRKLDAAFRALQDANARLRKSFKNELREYHAAKRAQKIAEQQGK